MKNIKVHDFPFAQLWPHINPKRRSQLFTLFFLMIFSSVAEIFSIASIVPFIGAISSPEKLFNQQKLNFLIKLFDINSQEEILLPFTILFCAAVFFSGLMRVTVLWGSSRLSFALGRDLGLTIYRKTLYQQYQIHISRNSSEIISGVTSKVNNLISSVVFPMLTMVSSLIALISIFIVLIYISPLVTAIAFLGFGTIYLFLTLLLKKKKISNGYIISKQSSFIIKIIIEGLGGIKDILLNKSQNVYCNLYEDADIDLRRAQASSLFIAQSPRYFVETLGIILIALVAFYFANKSGQLVDVISTLGALAIGSQRSLPIMQTIYSSWSSIQGGYGSLSDTILLLNQPFPRHYKKEFKTLTFNKSIILKNISFAYGPRLPLILKNTNLKIKKGDRIGIIGNSGIGKSTLLDLLMGLLKPLSGSIFVDGIRIDYSNLSAWQTHISHVPQNIFLADLSIAENIAFGAGSKDIDYARVKWAAKIAQISQIVNKLPDKYETLIGERGVRLSGGQRQRIGIARALYKEANVIILDEATNALDIQIESKILNAICKLNLNMTLLIISHRMSTLKICNRILEFRDSKIRELKI